MARVKVCGITRPEDALLSVELGAWAIGFILWDGSKRAADPAVAAGIAQVVRRQVQLVGVFVNPTLDQVVKAADTIGLTHVQLHGDEGPMFCQTVAQRTGCKIIKAIAVGSAPDLVDAERYRVDFHLLDTKREGMRGGTGATWDWKLANTRKTKIPRIVSGGLNTENVAEAIAVTKCYAVDVASGTESAPGVKDPEKLQAFIWAATAQERADAEAAEAAAAAAAAAENEGAANEDEQHDHEEPQEPHEHAAR